MTTYDTRPPPPLTKGHLVNVESYFVEGMSLFEKASTVVHVFYNLLFEDHLDYL